VLGDDSTQNHEEDEHQRWFTGPNQVAAQKVTLTKKERAVLELLVQDGGTNQELAERLMVSESTIHHHLRNILQKLHLQNRTQLAVYAIRHGLFGPPTSSS
jgi:DNA-binding NarL/FixJ family response regulator